MQTVESTIIFLESKLVELKEIYAAHKDGSSIKGMFDMMIPTEDAKESCLMSIKHVCSEIDSKMPFDVDLETSIANY